MSPRLGSDGPGCPDIRRMQKEPSDTEIGGEYRRAGLYIPRRAMAGASQAEAEGAVPRRPELHPSLTMASSIMVSTAAVARATPAQSNMVAPFTGLRSSAAFPVTRRANADLSTLPSNGGRVQCMQVWPPEGRKKFETLSYLPDLSEEQLSKQVDYLLRNGWIPCIEFCNEGFVSRKYHASPGYYDGRYWTMWKLPMFGCTDSSQVMKEVHECTKAYPEYFNRIIGFDNRRQVQCISFITYKPPGTPT